MDKCTHKHLEFTNVKNRAAGAMAWEGFDSVEGIGWCRRALDGASGHWVVRAGIVWYGRALDGVRGCRTACGGALMVCRGCDVKRREGGG